jgi:hypothetical protein
MIGSSPEGISVFDDGGMINVSCMACAAGLLGITGGGGTGAFMNPDGVVGTALVGNGATKGFDGIA